MNNPLDSAIAKVKNISESRINIYDLINVGDPKLWLTSSELTAILNFFLVGKSFQGYKLRTRSKVVKSSICEILGYPIPKAFRKVQPRFSGQQFDTYVQKSKNLQIWNEEIIPERRYVIIRLNENYIVAALRVISGIDLALLDTTGKLTKKYQASLINTDQKSGLVNDSDTGVICTVLALGQRTTTATSSPIDEPSNNSLLPISQLFEKLVVLEGRTFKDAGHDQERNRGGELHRLVSQELGYKDFEDDGQFPDIRNQLLEVKLQTSPTIDLGLVSPDSEGVLDVERISGLNIRHCDVRYAIFYATVSNGTVTINRLIMSSGQFFFTKFRRFEGKKINEKLQIYLPARFFQDKHKNVRRANKDSKRDPPGTQLLF